ncbi:filamin-C-like [Saccostrea cucullata]|uniref:filamin-C-like n=1 Tax=Saccostrea cuccullata TaxID=36930 RepID=UPI002ED02EB2
MSGFLVNGYQSGLVPRSNAEWVNIQKNTFTNWVNEQLRMRGLSIHDLRTDLADGVSLVALLEVLQRRRITGVVERPSNPHEALQNLNVALEAIGEDNVRIVNIGCTDITEGNIKLVLALIWQLILRYQVGLSNIQHKNWMLAWLQAVIPECNITNFTTDWNDGVALHALIEFCSPGLCPNWKHLRGQNRLSNCQNGIKIARKHFGIPLILNPEHLSSSQLDDLSCITYLSYFLKVGSPGFNATLQRIQSLVRDIPVSNFTTDWNDGRVLCQLVTNLGGNLGDFHTASNIERLQYGIDGAQSLGIYPIMTAADMAEEDSEHLGIMAYAAKFINMKPISISAFSKYEQKQIIVCDERQPVIPSEAVIPIRNTGDSKYTVIQPGVNKPDRTRSFRIERINNGPKVNSYQINGIETRPESSFRIEGTSVTSDPRPKQKPEVNGYHDTVDGNVTYNLIRQPSLRKAKKTRPDPTGGVKVDTYSVGVIMSSTTNDILLKDDIKIEALSPNGRIIKMSGVGTYNAQFEPDEIGEWRVSLYCQGKRIDSCPVDVCDPSRVRVIDLKGGIVGRPNRFKVDCSEAGKGDLEIFVKNDKGRVSSFCSDNGHGIYNVNFTPYLKGLHYITVNFNRAEIRDDEILLGADGEGMHRRAIFFSEIIEEDDGKFKVKASCDWQIDYVTGGPYEVSISDSVDVKVYSMKDGTICNLPHLIADCSEAPEGRLDAEITYGHERFPATVTETNPKIYQITFRPRGKGTYKVWLVYSGLVVKGSPFIIEVDELTAPKAEGDGLRKGVVGQPAKFKIDSRGFPGDLHIDIQGPHYPINFTRIPDKDGTFNVTYTPEETGSHKIRINIDGRPIEKSPFTVKVVDPNKIRVSGGWRPLIDDNERIPLVVGKEKQIPFDASEAGPGELTADVCGPTTKIPTAVEIRPGGRHTLVFTPEEEGDHYINVKWDDFPLPNTPYLGYATKPPPDSNGGLFRPVINLNLNTGSPRSISSDEQPRVQPTQLHSPLHSPVNILFELPKGAVMNSNTYPLPAPDYPDNTSRNTSPRSINVIRRPSDTGYPKTRVSKMYLPQRAESMYSSTNSDLPVRVNVVRRSNTTSQGSSLPSTRRSSVKGYPAPTPPTKDPSKVVLSGKGLKHAHLDKPAVFTIDGRNAGEGEPEVRITGVNKEIPVKIEPTGPLQYRCTYTPTDPGAYLLDITWNKRPLKCCPFKINVNQPVYPHKVNVSGHPLKSGVVGRDIQLHIDPRNAGLGDLTVKCVGPQMSEVPVTLVDNYDGTHSVKLRPAQPGRHILHIMYGNEHVHGSPYAIDIKTPRKQQYPVRVYGPGISDGILPEFESHFMVDAQGAGAGELKVVIMGPKGAFNVELSRTSQKDKLVHCRYSPVEPGLYTINVIWSNEHVEGSPFKVNLATSQLQLERMLMERRASLPRSLSSSKEAQGDPENQNILY